MEVGSRDAAIDTMCYISLYPQDIHNSRDGAHIPPCSHLLHLTCYQDMLAQGLYACPTCGLAMQDMSRYWRNMDAEVAATPMPR